MAQERPTERQPKGDHNRRLSLGIDPDAFAAEAGITTEQLRDYERISPDHRFDPAVAARVGDTLDRLEAVLPNSQTGRGTPEGDALVVTVGAGGTSPGTHLNPPTDPRYGMEGDPARQTGRDVSRPADAATRRPKDLPGADGAQSAGANEDTYD